MRTASDDKWAHQHLVLTPCLESVIRDHLPNIAMLGIKSKVLMRTFTIHDLMGHPH